MSGRILLNRRRFLTLAGAGASGLVLAGCDAWSEDGSTAMNLLDQVDKLTEGAQNIFLGDQTLAREFPESMISAHFRANGTTEIDDPAYQAMAAGDFADYRLPVTGLVDNPLELSLADLRAMPARTQITRHDCVEGWSSIGKWSGPQLGPILMQAGIRPEAKFVVFYCYDRRGADQREYYESVAMSDAFHPQTILAHSMNDETLPIRYGAPIRMRIERQLGYKMAKFVRAIEVVDGFADIRGGKGGYYEDGAGYEWYAGI